MTIPGRFWSCSVVCAVTMYPGTGHGFIAGRAAISRGRGATGARPGWAVGPAKVAVVPVMGDSPAEEAKKKAGNSMAMHSDYLNGEPSASENLFSWMSGMAGSTDRLEDALLGEAEAHTAAETLKAVGAREREEKREEEEKKKEEKKEEEKKKEEKKAEEKKKKNEESKRMKKKNRKKEEKGDMKHKPMDRAGLPPRGRTDDGDDIDNSGDFSHQEKVNGTTDGFVPDPSIHKPIIVVSLEEDGVSVVVVHAPQRGRAEHVGEVGIAAVIERSTAYDNVIRIGNTKKRRASIMKVGWRAKGGTEESCDASASESSDK